jgi:hypothetical protein
MFAMSSTASRRLELSSLLLAVLFMSTAAWPRSGAAQASRQEFALGLGPTMVGVPHFGAGARGFGGQLGLNYGVTRSWNLAAAANLASLRGRVDEVDVRGRTASVFSGVAYNVDVLTVVPYVSLMAGWQGGRLADSRASHFGLRAAIGADYRPSRQWGFGVQIEWHAAFPEVLNYPSETVLWLRAVRYFDLRRF